MALSQKELSQLYAHRYGAPQSQQTPDSDSSQFTKGLVSGIDQTQGLLYGGMALVGDLVGSESMKDIGMRGYERNMQEAAQNAGTSSFTDVLNGEGSFTDWTAYTLGNLAPTMATMLVSGGVGGAIAKKGLQSYGKRVLADQLSKGVKKEVAEKAAEAAVKKHIGYAIGSGSGAFLGSTAMEAGGIYGETEDPEVSLVHGAIAGAVDAWPGTAILNNLTGRAAAQAVKKEATKSIKREVAEMVLKEGGTEALQGFVEQHANYWVANDGRSLLGDLDSVDWQALIDEGAAGALGGAAFGGSSVAANRLLHPSQKIKEEDDKARKEAASTGGDALDQTLAAANARVSTENPAPVTPSADSVGGPSIIDNTAATMEALDTEHRNVYKQLQKASAQLKYARDPGQKKEIGKQLASLSQQLTNIEKQRNDLFSAQSDPAPTSNPAYHAPTMAPEGKPKPQQSDALMESLNFQTVDDLMAYIGQNNLINKGWGVKREGSIFKLVKNPERGAAQYRQNWRSPDQEFIPAEEFYQQGMAQLGSVAAQTTPPGLPFHPEQPKVPPQQLRIPGTQTDFYASQTGDIDTTSQPVRDAVDARLQAGSDIRRRAFDARERVLQTQKQQDVERAWESKDPTLAAGFVEGVAAQLPKPAPAQDHRPKQKSNKHLEKQAAAYRNWFEQLPEQQRIAIATRVVDQIKSQFPMIGQGILMEKASRGQLDDAGYAALPQALTREETYAQARHERGKEPLPTAKESTKQVPEQYQKDTKKEVPQVEPTKQALEDGEFVGEEWSEQAGHYTLKGFSPRSFVVSGAKQSERAFFEELGGTWNQQKDVLFPKDRLPEIRQQLEERSRDGSIERTDKQFSPQVPDQKPTPQEKPQEAKAELPEKIGPYGVKKISPKAFVLTGSTPAEKGIFQAVKMKLGVGKFMSKHGGWMFPTSRFDDVEQALQEELADTDPDDDPNGGSSGGTGGSPAGGSSVGSQGKSGKPTGTKNSSPSDVEGKKNTDLVSEENQNSTKKVPVESLSESDFTDQVLDRLYNGLPEWARIPEKEGHRDQAENLANAIRNKEVEYLLSVLDQGAKSNTASKSIFQWATGNEGIGMTATANRKAVFEWVGMDEAAIAERDRKRKEKLDKDQKEWEEKDIINRAESLSMGSDIPGVKTLADWVNNRIEAGFTQLKKSDHKIPHYHFFNPEEESFYDLATLFRGAGAKGVPKLAREYIQIQLAKRDNQEAPPVKPVPMVEKSESKESTSDQTKKIIDAIRKSAEKIPFRVGDKSLVPLAKEIAEHTIEHRRRMSDDERQNLADKHGVDPSVIQAINQQPFFYEGILGRAQSGDKGAQAFFAEKKEKPTKPTKETQSKGDSSSQGDVTVSVDEAWDEFNQGTKPRHRRNDRGWVVVSGGQVFPWFSGGRPDGLAVAGGTRHEGTKFELFKKYIYPSQEWGSPEYKKNLQLAKAAEDAVFDAAVNTDDASWKYDLENKILNNTDERNARLAAEQLVNRVYLSLRHNTKTEDAYKNFVLFGNEINVEDRLMRLRDEHLSSVKDAQDTEQTTQDKPNTPKDWPIPLDGWRYNRIKARKYAQELGLEWKKKSKPLEKLVSEIIQHRLDIVRDMIAGDDASTVKDHLDNYWMGSGLDVKHNPYFYGGKLHWSEFVEDAKLKGIPEHPVQVMWQEIKGKSPEKTDKPTKSTPHTIDQEIDQLLKKNSLAKFVVDYIEGQLDSPVQVKMDWRKLFKAADEYFGGTQAEGKYAAKDAYEVMEYALNLFVLRTFPGNLGRSRNGINEVFDIYSDAQALLPTQSRRDDEQQKLQQFSTPHTHGAVAAWVLNIKPGDVVLEPTAGTGNLVTQAATWNPETIYANELSERRGQLLKQLPNVKEVFTENAELLNAILPAHVQPSAVIMNPPFSNSVTTNKTKQLLTGAKHVDQALRRLQKNGRLVAILGRGMEWDRAKTKDWWAKTQEKYNVRAVIRIDGQEYTKFGTSFDNVIAVIDKTEPTGEQPITGSVSKVEELIPLLKDVRNDRRSSSEPKAVESVQPQSSEGVEAQPASDAGQQGSTLPDTDAGRSGTQAGVSASSRQNAPTRADTSRQDTDAGTQSERRVPDHGRDQADRPATNSRHESPAVESNRDKPGDARPGGQSDAQSGDKRGSANTAGVDESSASEPVAAYEENTPTSEEVDDESRFAGYRPKYSVPNAKPHMSKLSESLAMASVPLPELSYKPAVPADVIKKGYLTDAQLEAVAYAGQAHSQTLPDGTRKGFMIGDGTGVGKTNEIMGTILDNWHQGRKRHVIVTKNDKLLAGAQNWADLMGIGKENVFQIRDALKAPNREGILFLTYGTLSTTTKANESRGIQSVRRIDQVLEFLGKDFDGVVAFDESHMMQNCLEMKAARGKKKPSKNAMAGVELQANLPQARVLYASATGATEVHNLGYADRLGLWGEGTPFNDKRDFISKIDGAGIAAMEVVAKDMKAQGAYMARSLSYDDVTQERIVHQLSDNQRAMYNKLAEAWQIILKNVNEAMQEETGSGSDGNARSAAMSAFWGAHQRFFNTLITSMQVPSLIKSIEQHLKKDHSVVIQLVSTNEATQERRLQQAQAQDIDLADVDLTPKDLIIEFLEKSFPTEMYQEVEDENGNTKYEVVKDAEGHVVHSPEAIERRERLIDDTAGLSIPEGPLEQLLNHFGSDAVTEVTGRKRRLVRMKNGTVKLEKITKNTTKRDIKEFEDGKRRILVFSGAGGTGVDYHASNDIKNQQRRIHFLLEPGWRADEAVQGLGRTHRTNQASAPHDVLMTSDINAQKRFVSTIARRLEQLGALTKGQRDTTSSGLMSAADNLENEYASDALQSLWKSLEAGTVEGLDYETVIRQMGLINEAKESAGGQRKEIEITISKFLNRLLSMDLAMQNKLFDAFEQRIQNNIAYAKEQGTYEEGIERVKAKAITKQTEKTIWQETGKGKTEYVKLETRDPAKYRAFEITNAITGNTKSKWCRNKRSKKLWLAQDLGMVTNRKTGDMERAVALHGIRYGDQKIITFRELHDKYQVADESYDDLKQEYDQMIAKAPQEIVKNVHLITGALLPVWDRLPEYNVKVFRATTTDTNESFLGRIVPESEINETLTRLGIKGDKINIEPSELVSDIIDGNKIAKLANDWLIKRSWVGGEYRLEIQGQFSTSDFDMLIKQGAKTERISYNRRVFVPLGEAETVLKRVTKGKPVMSLASQNRYSLRKEKLVGRGVPVPVVNGILKALGFGKAVRSEKDLPEHLYEQIKADGAEGLVKGVFDQKTGHIYLVANNLGNSKDAIHTACHELVGHHGLRQLLGKRLNFTLDQIYRSLPGEKVLAMREKYAQQLANLAAKEQERLIAEEHLAHLAETNPKNTWVQRAVNAIRIWLRKLFPRLKWSDSEMVALIRAARVNMSPEPTPGGGPGSRGRYLLGGKGAKTANRTSLEKAQALMTAGSDPNTIWKETGWNMLPDGKWRFEIDDGEALFHDQLGTPHRVKLKDVLTHDAFFAAYPSLRMLPVDLKEKKGGQEYEGSAVIHEKDLRIELYLPKENGEYRFGKAEKETLLHEIQHFIQYGEGFASGADPETLKKALPADRASEDIELYRDALRLKKWLALKKSGMEAVQSFKRDHGRDPHKQALHKAKTLSRKALKYYYNRAEGVIKPDDVYNRHHGEIEARDVSLRWGESRAWREENAPLTHEMLLPRPDRIDIDDVVFRAQDGGIMKKAASADVRYSLAGSATAAIDGLTKFAKKDSEAVEDAGRRWRQLKGKAQEFLLYASNGRQIESTFKHLFDTMGDVNPLTEYQKLLEKMIAERQNWGHRGDKIDQLWGKIPVNSGDYDNLAAIMPAATLAGVDPSKAYATDVDVEELRQRVHELNNVFPRGEKIKAPAGSDGKQGWYKSEESAKNALKAMLAKGVYPGPIGLYEVREHAGTHGNTLGYYIWPKAEEATNLHDALVKKWKAESARKRRYDELVKDWNALSPEAQKVYRQVRDYHMDMWEDTKTALIDKAYTLLGRSGARGKIKAIIDAEFNTNSLSGPYFPLSRFGDWVIIGELNENGEAVYFREQYDSQADMEKARAELRKQGHTILSSGKKADYVGSEMAGNNRLAAEIYKALNDDTKLTDVDPMVKQAFMAEVNQIALSMLPDLSAAKHSIHRKGTAGYNKNARRAFADTAIHGANRLTRTKYGYLMEEQLDSMKNEAAENNHMTSIPEKDQPAAMRVVDEMRKRHETIMNPKGSPVAAYATNAAFLWFMGASIGAGLINLTQTPLVALPQLGARYGWGKASKVLAKAMKDWMKGGKGKWTLHESLWSLSRAEAGANVSADEIAMIKQLINDGTIDTTATHTQAQVADTDLRPESRQLNQAMTTASRVAGTFFHNAETLNRELCALAAYRLFLEENPGDIKGAIQAAKDAVLDGHFDYSGANRARMLKGNVAKVMFIFKQYSLNITHLLGKAWYDWKKNDHISDQERKQARDTLVGVLGMHFVAAGALGLPFVSTFLMLASQALSDDDEVYDAEAAFRNQLAQWFGKDIGHAIAKGGVNAFTGLDLHSRTSLNELFIRDPDFDATPRELYQHLVTQLLGPMGSMTFAQFNGFDLMSQGRYREGIERMVPKFARDVSRALRYADEGATNLAGDTMVDSLNGVELAGQLLGLSPAAMSEAYDAKKYVKGTESAVKRRRGLLMSQYYRAMRDGDSSELASLRHRIRSFNRNNPAFLIKPEALRRSLRERVRRDNRTRHAIYLPDTKKELWELTDFLN